MKNLFLTLAFLLTTFFASANTFETELDKSDTLDTSIEYVEDVTTINDDELAYAGPIIVIIETDDEIIIIVIR